jgi:hypothetical protein
VSSRPRLILTFLALAALALAAVGPSVAAAAPVYKPGPVYTPAHTDETSEKSKPPGDTRSPSRPRIAARPEHRTHKHLARFVFLGPGQFECKVDRAPYRQCGPVFTHHVSVGKHVLRVREAGGGPAASFHWRVLPNHPH